MSQRCDEGAPVCDHWHPTFYAQDDLYLSLRAETDEGVTGIVADSSTPRVKTEDEVRKEFFDHVWSQIDYWAGEGASNVPKEYDARKRLEGLTHSFLALLDGCVGFFPGSDVVVRPHPEDKAFNETNGDNWFPPEGVDIGSALHEHLYSHPWPTNPSPLNPQTKDKDEG